MTIQELKDRKKKLEEIINSSINEFELETGVLVDKLYLSRKTCFSKNLNAPDFLSQVDIRLEI